MRHFEHFPAGTTYELGATRLTSEDIIDYARAWDPMPFHLDPEAARRVLEEGGISTREPREVVAIRCEDRPGELGRIASTVTEAGANIDLVYVTMDQRLVLGVDDPSMVREALGGD